MPRDVLGWRNPAQQTPQQTPQPAHPMVTLRVNVVALLVDGADVLLIHQRHAPSSVCWDLPGGRLDPAEDLMTGLRREIAEETGLTDVYIEGLLTVFEAFYPETVGEHTLNLAYRCRVSPRPSQFAPVDVDEIGPLGIRWWPVQDLRPEHCSDRAWAALIAANLVPQS